MEDERHKSLDLRKGVETSSPHLRRTWRNGSALTFRRQQIPPLPRRSVQKCRRTKMRKNRPGRFHVLLLMGFCWDTWIPWGFCLSPACFWYLWCFILLHSVFQNTPCTSASAHDLPILHDVWAYEPQGLGSASGLAIEGRTSEAWQVGGCWTASHESHESHETCFARKVNPADVVGQLERRGLSTRVASSAIMTSLKSIWNHWNSQKEQWSKSHTSFLEKVDIHPPEW